MSLASRVSQFLTSITGSFSLRPIPNSKNNGCLHVLSDDILVQHILIRLDVEDVMSMRRVNKLFYYLTHSPVIWKRFMRLLKLPLPPLPHTSRYSFDSLACLEVERLVMRAITLDDNWRGTVPKTLKTWTQNTLDEVLDLALLPGGKYLVASMRDRGHKRYFLMVYILDRFAAGPVSLARLEIPTRAYNLQVKYMTLRDIEGITIAYVRRDFKAKYRDQAGIDPSDFSPLTDIDPPFPLKYECACVHISLETLDFLGDSRIPPGSDLYMEAASMQKAPFWMVTHITSRSQLDSVSLDEICGAPYLTVVKRPETIVFTNLNGKSSSTLRCERPESHADMENIIRNIKVFGPQGCILVVRSVALVDRTPFWYIETHDVPGPPNEVSRRAHDHWVFPHVEDNEIVTNVSFSDAPVPLSFAPSALSSPPPIAIFCSLGQSAGLLHYALWPEEHHGSRSSSAYYLLDNVVLQSFHKFADTDVVRVLPGAYRALVYTVPAEDRTATPPIVDIYSYISPRTMDADNGDAVMEDVSEPQVIMKRRKPHRKNILALIAMTRGVRMGLREGGATAIAWDEGIGRVCAAVGGKLVVHILDFAKAPRLDCAGQRLPVPLPKEHMLQW